MLDRTNKPANIMVELFAAIRYVCSINSESFSSFVILVIHYDSLCIVWSYFWFEGHAMVPEKLFATCLHTAGPEIPSHSQANPTC